VSKRLLLVLGLLLSILAAGCTSPTASNQIGTNSPHSARPKRGLFP
jgi:hypothetical protein